MTANENCLTVELNSGCDSDFEIINNSDTETESIQSGYQRLKGHHHHHLDDIKSRRKPLINQQLRNIMRKPISNDNKIMLSLSQEQITLIGHQQQQRNNLGELSSTSEALRKSCSSSSFANPGFSIVPIKIPENPIITKTHLPEIVLTSFDSGDQQKESSPPRTLPSSVDNSGETSELNPSRKISCDAGTIGFSPAGESYRSQGSDLEAMLPSSLAPVKPLNLNQSLTYRPSIDISLRPSDGSFNPCQGFNEIQQHYSESIPSELKCRICNQIFKDPRTLNCLHSFCLECLINENYGSDASIPFWSGPDVISYEWRGGNSDTYNSNSSSTQDSDSPILSAGGRSDSRQSTATTSSSKRTEKSLKSTKKDIPKSISCNEVEKVKFLTCSVCQYLTEMPVGGIIQLPQNYILIRKIENYIATIRERGRSNMWCNLCCDAVPATYHCVTCAINLCGFCKEAHERQRSTAHHQTNSLLELNKFKDTKFHVSSGPKFTLKCALHPGFELKIFCLICQQIICTECNILLHKGHKTESVHKVYKTYEKHVKETTEKTKPLCEYANHAISKLAAISKKINEKCDQVQQEVDIHLAAYFDALEAHRNTLIQQITRARETKVQMILEQQLDLEKRSSEAKMVIEFSEELLNVGSEAEILSFVDLLIKRYEYCSKYKPLLDSKISDTLHFLPEVRAPSTKAQNNIPMYGIITTQTVEPSYCTLETEGYDQLRVHRKAELVILSRDSDGMPLCHGGLTLNAVLKYKDSSARSVPFQISDRRDGSYVISFLPDAIGILVLSVMISNKHIKGSPFALRSKSQRPHAGTFHCCAFCSSKGSKAAVCACDGVMPGFKGCGHGHAGHPGRRHWSCCASVLENSECTTSNKF